MIDLPKLEDFPHHDYDKLRYGDMDNLGHVNNAVFATLLETGRTGLLNHPDIDAWTLKDYSYVLARLEIDFRAELLWPGTVQIGTAVKSVGKSSMVLVQALFQDQKCAATGLSVLVQVDKVTHKPVPLSEENRAILEGLMLKT